jgi:hypothetical protein
MNKPDFSATPFSVTMKDPPHRLNSSVSDENFKLTCDAILPKLVRLDQLSIDSILKHNDPQQSQIVLPDGRKFVWYFAIGSMTNPISLYLRGLTPIESYPVMCPNYKMTFPDNTGMADIEYCPGIEIHGVVHLLPDEQMACLDVIEGFYHRILVNVVDYQGQSHTVYVYKMNAINEPASPPAERYLDIIVKGCEYHNVRPEYIDRLKREQLVKPRKQPQAFRSFTDIPSNVFYSLTDLSQHNGSNPDLSLWTSVNGKILEYAGIPDIRHPDYEEQKRFLAFFQPRYGGHELVYAMAKVLYEPLYKLPLSEEDMSDEHRAMIEDSFFDWVAKDAVQASYWKPIGRLLPPGDTL